LDTIALGKHNPRVADIRKAIRSGTLTEDGFLPVEGPNLLREALGAGLQIFGVFLRQGTDLPAELRRVRSFWLDPATFKGIQATEHSQGVVSLVRLRSWDLESMVKAVGSPLVVLVGLQDPGNVGTILRVAEAFGAAGCIGIRGTCSIFNSKVVRASAGSLFRLPHVWEVEWDAVSAMTRLSGIPLVATSPRAGTPIADWDWSKPTAVLIGNEGQGIPQDYVEACAATLRIPQRAPVESLNSAVASAVILYEAFRQRGES
jgi:TrmH family RNA methyltransferase